MGFEEVGQLSQTLEEPKFHCQTKDNTRQADLLDKFIAKARSLQFTKAGCSNAYLCFAVGIKCRDVITNF